MLAAKAARWGTCCTGTSDAPHSRHGLGILLVPRVKSMGGWTARATASERWRRDSGRNMWGRGRWKVVRQSIETWGSLDSHFACADNSPQLAPHSASLLYFGLLPGHLTEACARACRTLRGHVFRGNAAQTSLATVKAAPDCYHAPDSGAPPAKLMLRVELTRNMSEGRTFNAGAASARVFPSNDAAVVKVRC
ncbi:hypothetical protein VDGL01_06831 [Verticillium dahliae]